MKKELTYDYFLNIINELKENRVLGVSDEGLFKESFLSRMYWLMPESFKEHFLRSIIKPLVYSKTYYHLSKENIFPSSAFVRFALDFLYYIMAHPNLSFDLSLFPEKDHKEIIKFAKNKIYLSLLSYIPKKLVFNEVDLKFQKKYISFFNKHIKYNLLSNKTKIIYKNVDYFFPILTNEPSVWYHSLGLPEVPKKVLTKLKDKIALDCGAFVGDSSIVLSRYFREVYGFEPEKKNFELFKKTLSLNELTRIIPINKGVGNKNQNLRMNSSGLGASISTEGNEIVSVIKIDDFVKENKLDVGAIKMDIEGFEYNAILGAEETIKKFKPILMICLYHKGKDFFEIPALIKKWVPEYKFRFLNLDHFAQYTDRILLAYTE